MNDTTVSNAVSEMANATQEFAENSRTTFKDVRNSFAQDVKDNPVKAAAEVAIACGVTYVVVKAVKGLKKGVKNPDKGTNGGFRNVIAGKLDSLKKYAESEMQIENNDSTGTKNNDSKKH